MFKSEKGAFLFTVFTTFLFSIFPTFSLSAYTLLVTGSNLSLIIQLE